MAACGGNGRRRQRAVGVALVVVASVLAPTAGAAAAPPGRAYERVSPVDANGHGTIGPRPESVISQVAADGNSILYNSNEGGIPGDLSSPVLDPLVARRTPTGWATTPMTPPTLTVVPTLYTLSSPIMTRDLTAMAFVTDARLTSDAPSGGENIYLRRADGSVRLLTDVPPADAPSGGAAPDVVGAAADLSRVIFASQASMTPDTDGASTVAGNLYAWRDGRITAVAVLPDGTVARGSGAGANVPGVSGSESLTNAVSADGSRVFFNAPLAAGARAVQGQLYVRLLDRGETREVSAPAPGGSNPERSPASFQTATPDGRHAFFTSKAALTADANTGAGADLYRYDVETSTLTDVAPGAEVDASAGVAASEDGAYVYFNARGRLADGAPPAGQPALYVAHAGTVRLVAPELVPLRSAATTPDGRFLVFASSAKLTRYDPRGSSEVYRYAAETGALRCVSCDPSGAPPAGSSPGAALGEVHPGQPFGNHGYQRHLVSDDGRRVFFSSAERLVPGAVTDAKKVYLWEEGKLELISTGRNPDDDYFLDASASGDDVFFGTAEPLVADDRDGNYDLYSAHVGGGFRRSVEPPPCDPARCRGSFPPAAGGNEPGSATFHGAGNGASGRRRSPLSAAFTVARVTKRQRSALARTGRLVLRVRCSLPTRLSARIVMAGRRDAVVARATAAVRRPGAVARLRLVLARGARAALARGGTVRLRIEVVSSRSRRPWTATVRLRAPGRRDAGRRVR